MLVRKLFTVYDVKAEVHFPPFACGTTAEALRQFESLLKSPDSILSKYPADYRLFCVGDFHVDTGVVYGLLTGPQLIEEGLLLVKEGLSA